jgi:BRCT domain type II-containing protein
MHLKSSLDGEFLEHGSVLQATRESLAELSMLFCGIAETVLNGGNRMEVMKNGGREMVGLASPLLIIPSDSTHRIQKMQTFLEHKLEQ